MKINRLIFVDEKGNARSAMACALFKKMYPDLGIEALARGLVVSFGEPLNQKAEAVMAGKGLETEGFISMTANGKNPVFSMVTFTLRLLPFGT